MPAKQKRDKKYEFLLEIEFTGESETNAHNFTALKDALNKKDDKNTVKELIAMKSKNDKKRFMMLVLYNNLLAGVNYQSLKVKGYKQNKVLVTHKFECISCKHSHAIDSFARAKLGG